MKTAKRWLRALKARLVMAALLGSPHPINPSFGWSVGTPVDRRYIDAFLTKNAALIAGRVLEVGDRAYTTQFGGDRVTRSDVVSAVADEADPGVIVGDLADLGAVADETYDCVILTQTLHYIFDMPRAVAELHRVLAPGGSALVTVPGVSQISRWDMERWGDRWRLTDLSLTELLGTRFDAADIAVSTYGNASSAVAFLLGIPAEQVPGGVIDAVHPDYPVLAAAVARKQRL